jgi:ketosteroid isomerase-like protein
MASEQIRATNRVFEEDVVGRRDFGALERVYTRDARILPPDAPAVTGRAAIIEFWRGAITAMNVKSLRLHTLSLDVLSDDRAQEVGRAELTVEGGGAGPVALKYVVLWKREDGSWRLDVDIWNADGG